MTDAYQDHKYRHLRNGIAPLPAGSCPYCDDLIEEARRDLAGTRRHTGISPYSLAEMAEILRAERQARRREQLSEAA